MKLKYHRLITVLTELALVCLVFVTISACMSAWNEKEKEEYVQDGLVAWYDGTNNTNGDPTTKAELWKDLTGNDNHISSSDSINRVELQTGESGNIQYFVSGSQIEAVTDENGQVYYYNITQPDLDSGNQSAHISYGITFVINSAFHVLACVLLLLYALRFYNHSKAATVMGLVFIPHIIVAAINLCFNLSRHFDILLVASDLLQITLFAILTVFALKNKLSPKISLVAMICSLVNIALPVITGSFLYGDVLNIIINLLWTIGFLTFTVAWFLCSFKEQDAPTVEAAEPVAAEAE